MATILTVANRLLPFATPGTPLLQDILHLTALCVLLYLAPQIQQRLQAWHAKSLIRGELEVAAQNRIAHENRQIHPESHHQAPNNDLDAQDTNDRGNGPDDFVQIPEEGFQADLDIAPEDGQPGPARGPDLIPPQRNVGAKKAKSLARKDQRRAYHEFMRSQGDAQRAKDAEGAEEREAALTAQREKRKAAERELEARKAKEREAKREREELQRKENARLTDLVLSTVRDELESRRMCDLFRLASQVGDDVDEDWIETVLRASGMLGKKGDTMTMITGMGWVVRVTGNDMAIVYEAMIADDLGDDDGRVSNETFGTLLEGILREHKSVEDDHN